MRHNKIIHTGRVTELLMSQGGWSVIFFSDPFPLAFLDSHFFLSQQVLLHTVFSLSPFNTFLFVLRPWSKATLPVTPGLRYLPSLFPPLSEHLPCFSTALPPWSNSREVSVRTHTIQLVHSLPSFNCLQFPRYWKQSQRADVLGFFLLHTNCCRVCEPPPCSSEQAI